MPPTNAQTAAGPALDFRSFTYMFRGRRPGMVVGKDVSPEDHDADKRAYEYYTKKSVDQAMTVQQPVQPPQFMSLTNSEGRVIDVMIKPDGEPIVVNPQTLNTQQGMFTQVNPTNVAPIIDPRTGQQVRGYASRIDLGEDGATLGAYTPGASAPQQTPAPTPDPQAAPAAAPQADQPVQVIHPDGRRGIIPAAQVDQAIKQGFRLVP